MITSTAGHEKNNIIHFFDGNFIDNMGEAKSMMIVTVAGLYENS